MHLHYHHPQAHHHPPHHLLNLHLLIGMLPQHEFLKVTRMTQMFLAMPQHPFRPFPNRWAGSKNIKKQLLTLNVPNFLLKWQAPDLH